jgi:flagellar basal-body rod modification protein FlgD
MTHQDPTKPMDNGEFLSQMAQFSSVSGIQDLQKSFGDFATSMGSNQALQASNLVGQYVSTPSDVGKYNTSAGYLSGSFDLPSASSNVDVQIIDPNTNHVVKTIDLGKQAAGSVSFIWDGKDAAGNPAPDGMYKIQPAALLNGVNTTLKANVDAKVDSVSMSATNGVQLNLDGLGTVSLSKIKEIL